MIDLTKRQNEILDFIKGFLFMNGYPPTREEIATKFGFVSVNAAQCHLIALKVKGYITVAPGVSRGIALTNLGTKTKTILRMTA